MLFKVTHGRLLEQLRGLSTSLKTATWHAVSDAVVAGTDSAKGTALFKDVTGKLRRSIIGRPFGVNGKIAARAPYATFIENGTRPHIIEARKAKMLRFVQNGVVRFARSVRHPGTAPRPFMYEARRIAAMTLAYGMDLHLEEAIRRYAR